MILNKTRLASYLISVILLSFLILTIPISQPFKYLLFIIINFFLITFPNRISFWFAKKFIFSLLIFFSLITFINIIPLQFKIEVNSFGNANFEKISDEALNFYKKNYPKCYKKASDCYGYGDYNIKFNNVFFRNYINISNLNELRSNIFTSPKTTLPYNNHYIDKYNYPFYLNFSFPSIYIGSNLCFINFENTENCYLISKSNNSFELIGKSEKNQIYLKQSLIIVFIKILFSIILFISFLFILKNLYNFKIRENFELLYPLSFIFWLIIFSKTNIENINFLNSYFYQYPGGDGYWYLFAANLVSENLKQFNLIEAFRAGRDIFYFMPGMRYFVGIEKFIYGNSYYLHLIILSFLPFIIRKFLDIYLPKKLVFILMFSFLFFPLMHHMGFSYFQFIRYASKVFAEPIAYTIFLFGFVRFIYFFKDKQLFYSSLPFTCLLLTISSIMRPNLASSSFFLLLIPFFYLIFKRKIMVFSLFSISGLVIFLPLLHNYYFGQNLVLFTAAVFTDANIKITYNDYLTLFTTFDLSNDKKIMLIEMLKNFFNPFEIHKYFIFIGVIISLRLKNLKNKALIPIYILIFSQFYLFLFINPSPRYIWIFWIASLILSIHTFLNLKFVKK